VQLEHSGNSWLDCRGLAGLSRSPKLPATNFNIALKPHVAAPIGSPTHTFNTSTYNTLGRIISPYTSSVSVDTDLRYPPEA
jgi:hypothetical protein